MPPDRPLDVAGPAGIGPGRLQETTVNEMFRIRRQSAERSRWAPQVAEDGVFLVDQEGRRVAEILQGDADLSVLVAEDVPELVARIDCARKMTHHLLGYVEGHPHLPALLSILLGFLDGTEPVDTEENPDVDLDEVIGDLLSHALDTATTVAAVAHQAAQQYGHDPGEHIAGALQFLRDSLHTGLDELLDGVVLEAWNTTEHAQGNDQE